MYQGQQHAQAQQVTMQHHQHMPLQMSSSTPLMHSQLQTLGGVGLGVNSEHGINLSHSLLVSSIKQQAVDVLPDLDREKEKQARENHCEIERRRRVKMAAYFNELCVMVPTCSTLQRKPDKLTILRMASSHMRNLRGHTPTGGSLGADSAYKPSFLTDQELKHLILEAADGFLFVAQCDTGNIIYVSDAVQPVLSYMPNEWTHRSLFDFVHPDDLDKVKDQLSTQENSSNNTSGRVLDLKTGTVKKEGHPNSVRSHIGSRRSFICRVKLGNSQHLTMQDQQQAGLEATPFGLWSTNSRANRTQRNTLQSMSDTNDENLKSQQNQPAYSVIHITGYTKIWPPNSNSASSHSDHHQHQGHHHHHNQLNYQQLDEHGQPTSAPAPQQMLHQNTNFHLIAIARIQMTSAPTDLVNSSKFEFVTRHDANGVITFVDQRITSLLGYQPSELLKKGLDEFLIPQDQQLIKEQLKSISEAKQTQPVQINLNFISSPTMQQQQQETVIPFKTSAYAFCNPCNETFEFIVCTHVCQNRVNQTNSTILSNSTHHNSNLNIDYSQQYQNLNQHNYYSTNGNGGYPFQSNQQGLVNQNLSNPQIAYGGSYTMMQSLNSQDPYNAQIASSSPIPSVSSNENATNSKSISTNSATVSSVNNLTSLERAVPSLPISNGNVASMAWSTAANNY